MSSYVDETGEWENRKITIFGALHSFISQLTIGEDLTKISLPSVLLFPYSALELAGSRGVGYADIFLRANREQDPLERFLGVIKWFLTYTQKEKLGKKPYNPILGETHLSWVDTSDKLENSGVTKFFGEQVCHHPPVTAYIVENSAENVRIQSVISFSTNFHGNSVTITPDGPMIIEFKNHNEVYKIEPSMPNVAIKNVIIGTRRHVWEGNVTITCEASGYKANLNYFEEGWWCINTVNGSIAKIANPEAKLFTFAGSLSDVVTITNCQTNKADPLIDLGKLTKRKIQYLPYEKLDERASLRLWRDLSKAIVDDDMYKADVAKRIVEDAQRKRRAEGTSYKPQYFSFDETKNAWTFNQEKLTDMDKMIATAKDPIKTESKSEIQEGTEKQDQTKNETS